MHDGGICKVLFVSVPQRSGVLSLQKDHESYHSFSALGLLVLGTHPGPLDFNFQKYPEEDLRRGQNCIDHLDTARWVKKEISVCSRKYLSLQFHPFQIQVTRLKNKLLIMLYNIWGAKHDLGHVHSALPWPLNNQKEEMCIWHERLQQVFIAAESSFDIPRRAEPGFKCCSQIVIEKNEEKSKNIWCLIYSLHSNKWDIR